MQSKRYPGLTQVPCARSLLLHKCHKVLWHWHKKREAGTHSCTGIPTAMQTLCSVSLPWPFQAGTGAWGEMAVGRRCFGADGLWMVGGKDCGWVNGKQDVGPGHNTYARILVYSWTQLWVAQKCTTSWSGIEDPLGLLWLSPGWVELFLMALDQVKLAPDHKSQYIIESLNDFYPILGRSTQKEVSLCPGGLLSGKCAKFCNLNLRWITSWEGFLSSKFNSFKLASHREACKKIINEVWSHFHYS